MRWAPGARLPAHEHVAIEQTYVLEGSFADHAGVCTAGNYVWRRAGSRHDAWTDEGCLDAGGLPEAQHLLRLELVRDLC